MSDVKRYKAVINDKPYKPYAYCEESSDGIYVRYDDYAALQQKLDAVLAERDKFAVQCAAAKIAVKYAKAAGFECTLNTPDVDAFLNEVRAEGAQYCIDAIVTSDSADFIDAPNICTEVIRQLRAGSTEGGV